MKTTIKAKSAGLIAVAFLASMIAAATPAAAQWRGPAVWGPRPGPFSWARLAPRPMAGARLVGARGRGGSGHRRHDGGDHRLVFRRQLLAEPTRL
jgi:hypothetical protein